MLFPNVGVATIVLIANPNMLGIFVLDIICSSKFSFPCGLLSEKCSLLGADISLRKQPSFFAPGPSGVPNIYQFYAKWRRLLIADIN